MPFERSELGGFGGLPPWKWQLLRGEEWLRFVGARSCPAGVVTLAPRGPAENDGGLRRGFPLCFSLFRGGKAPNPLESLAERCSGMVRTDP